MTKPRSIIFTFWLCQDLVLTPSRAVRSKLLTEQLKWVMFWASFYSDKLLLHREGRILQLGENKRRQSIRKGIYIVALILEAKG